MKKVLSLIFVMIFFVCGLVFAQNFTIRNNKVEVVIDSNYGGAIKSIKWLGHSENVVDYYDKGRLVQLAIFGNRDYCDYASCCAKDARDPFNPTQGGANTASCGSVTNSASLFYVRNEIGRNWNGGAMIVPLNWQNAQSMTDKVRMAFNVMFPNNDTPGFIINADVMLKNLASYEKTSEKMNQELPVFYLQYSKFDTFWNGTRMQSLPTTDNSGHDVFTTSYAVLCKSGQYCMGFLTVVPYANVEVYEQSWVQLHIFTGGSIDGTGKTISVKRIIQSPVLDNEKIHTTTYVAFGSNKDQVIQTIEALKQKDTQNTLDRYYFSNTTDHYFNVNRDLRNTLSSFFEESLGNLDYNCRTGTTPLFEVYIPSWKDSFITKRSEIDSLMWNDYSAIAIGRFIGCYSENWSIPIDRWLNNNIKDHLLTQQGSPEESALPGCGYSLEGINFYAQ